MLEQQLAALQAETASLRGRLGAATAQLCAAATPSNPALMAVLKVRAVQTTTLSHQSICHDRPWALLRGPVYSWKPVLGICLSNRASGSSCVVMSASCAPAGSSWSRCRGPAAGHPARSRACTCSGRSCSIAVRHRSKPGPHTCQLSGAAAVAIHMVGLMHLSAAGRHQAKSRYTATDNFPLTRLIAM